MAASNTKIEDKPDKISFALVFLLLANFGSVVSVNCPRIVWASILLLCAIQRIRGRFRISKNVLLSFVVIWIIVLLSTLFTKTSISFASGVLISSFLALIVIACNTSFKSISNYIYLSCKIIAYLGLVNVFLYLLLPGLFTFHTGVTGYTVHTIFFIFNYQTGEIIRNQGLYWEPGVFQIVLNLFLFIKLVERNEPYKKAILPVILIVSTFSTTGLIIMSIILLYSLKKRRIKLTFKFFSLIIASFLLLAPLVYNNVKEKVSDDSMSAALRTYDIMMGLNIIKNNPIIGIGMDPGQFAKRSKGIDIMRYDVSTLELDDRGNTNTIISIAMMFGIPVLLLFLRSLYKQQLFADKKCFFVIICIALLSEPLFPFPFLFMLNMSSKPLKLK